MLDSLDFYGRATPGSRPSTGPGSATSTAPTARLRRHPVRRPAVLGRAVLLRRGIASAPRRRPGRSRSATNAARRARATGTRDRPQLPRGRHRDQRRQLDPGLAGPGPALGRRQHGGRPDVLGAAPRCTRARSTGSSAPKLRPVRRLQPDQPGLCLGGPRGPASSRSMAARPHYRTAATAERSWASRCPATAARPAPTTAASSRAPLRPADRRLRRLARIDPHRRPRADRLRTASPSTMGFPVRTRPRWGDYSAAVFAPGTGGKIYFATNYIQYPNCTGPAFTLTWLPAAEPGMPSPTGAPQ